MQAASMPPLPRGRRCHAAPAPATIAPAGATATEPVAENDKEEGAAERGEEAAAKDSEAADAGEQEKQTPAAKKGRAAKPKPTPATAEGGDTGGRARRERKQVGERPAGDQAGKSICGKSCAMPGAACTAAACRPCVRDQAPTGQLATHFRPTGIVLLCAFAALQPPYSLQPTLPSTAAAPPNECAPPVGRLRGHPRCRVPLTCLCCPRLSRTPATNLTGGSFRARRAAKGGGGARPARGAMRPRAECTCVATARRWLNLTSLAAPHTARPLRRPAHRLSAHSLSACPARLSVVQEVNRLVVKTSRTMYSEPCFKFKLLNHRIRFGPRRAREPSCATSQMWRSRWAS